MTLGLMAASAILRTEAQVLYPKDNKKDEARRAAYIDEHIAMVHPQVVASLQRWEARQRGVIERDTHWDQFAVQSTE